MTLAIHVKQQNQKKRALKNQILNEYFNRFFELYKDKKQKEAFEELEAEFFIKHGKNRYKNFATFQRCLRHHCDKY